MGKLKSGLGWSFQRDVFPAEELVFGSFHMFHLKSVCSTGENKSIPPPSFKDGEGREGWIDTAPF